MTRTLHVNGPADVLALLPYELGYHPQDSLVVLGLIGDRLGLRARVDLPPSDLARDTAAQLIGPLLDSGAQELLVIGYESAAGGSRPAIDAMTRVAVEAGLRLRGRLVVRGGRWFDVDCRDARCCPPRGRLVPAAHEVPAVSEFVAREVQPLPDRAALAASLRPARPLLARAVAVVAAQHADRRRSGARDAREDDADERADLAAWARVLDTSDDARPVPKLPPEDLARVATSLLDLEVRDGLIAWLCPGTPGFERAAPSVIARLRSVLPAPPDDELARSITWQRTEARLIALCQCLPSDWAVAPLTVLGSFTWWRGDGALTRIALELALEHDPTYRLAQLLLRMVDLSIRPRTASA